MNLDGGSTREVAFKPSEVKRYIMLNMIGRALNFKIVPMKMAKPFIKGSQMGESVAIVAVAIQDTRIHDLGSKYNMSIMIKMMNTPDSGWPSWWRSRPGRWVV